MKTLSKLGILSLSLVMALYSCNSGKSGNQQATNEHTEQAKEEVVKEVINYPIPTSYEVTNMLNDAGASYILSISNSADNVDKYFSESEKAINLGIYGADLAYASTYEMKQETMHYMKASKTLVEGLEISSNFNLDFAQRIEANLDNKDSLIQIITNSFYDTYQFLQENGKDNMALLVMAGSYIEGLYITTQIAIGAEEADNFIRIISNQKNPLNKLMELMEPVKEEADIASVYADLKLLSELFASEEGITQDKLNQITDKVSEIREKLI